MIEVPCIQLSPEWWESRRGIPTASNFGRIITPKSHKLSASAEEYANELVAELICQHPGAMTETPMNAAMRHGVECEPEAKKWYQLQKCEVIRDVGFCKTDDGRWGCSPDGLIGDDGVLETKCPQMKTHVGWLLAGEVPAEHMAQCHGHLVVTGRKWCDFLSYCPGAKPLLVRVTPNEYTMKLRTCLELFWDMYATRIAKVRAM